MISYRFGYDVTNDLHHGILIAWGKKPHLFGLHWNWPYFLWFDRRWALNEVGYVQGMPVYRRKPKRWTLRAWVWPVSLRIDDWRTSRWIYLGKK